MSKSDSLWTRLKKHWINPAANVDLTHFANKESHFSLLYKDTPVGTLGIKDGVWTFKYSEEFKHSGKLRTITEFPDVQRIYSSNELWPFFLMRIPSLRQECVRKIVDRENIDEHDEAKLLEMFGRRTVANPFELVPSEFASP